MTRQSIYGTFIQNVNEILTITRERQITHLFTEDESLNGRTVTIHNREMLNFSSCSYLGLELDQRLKQASIDAVEKFGTQFSMSRTYASVTPYYELENLLHQMFEQPIALATCSSLAHQATIPIIVEKGDAAIFDQQAHISMQEMRYKLQFNGVHVDVLKHNHLESLQAQIDRLKGTCNKIWYFLDGTYSMYGDFAPIHELMEMLEKNENLWLYIDDAHSMSVYGKNGTGYILSEIGKLHPRMILTVSLAKAFGSAGGVVVFPDEELCWKVKNWGGPLTYSGPQQPAVVAASVAAARIHLSPEMDELQNKLYDNIRYCNTLLEQYQLPVIVNNNSPIFFVGLGLTKMGYNMLNRLLDDGLFVNLGIFPAVNENCTGIRFTITVHHTKADIEKLIESIAFHLPQALKEEERTVKDIVRAFRSVRRHSEQMSQGILAQSTRFHVQTETSIRNIPQKLWDSLLGDNGNCTWNGLEFLENIFANNPLPENNWSFKYYLIRDEFNEPVIATFFTTVLGKDDMLMSETVSQEVEKRRVNDPYYLTSKNFMMGSLLTEGDHLYINKRHLRWKEALTCLLDTVWEEQELVEDTSGIILRDFVTEDTELREFFMERGFIPVEMPASSMLKVSWENKEGYMAQLNSKKRLQLRKYVLEHEDKFDVRIVQNASPERIQRWYELYDNVRKKSYKINSFKLPYKLFEAMSLSDDWECVEFSVKDGNPEMGTDAIVGVYFAFKSNNYSNVIVGLDYSVLDEMHTYRQSLYRTVMRATELGSDKIYLGLTSDFEKYKIGAVNIPKTAYVQMKDHFNVSVMSLIPETVKV